MYLWGRKWSPHPIPPPSQDCFPSLHSFWSYFSTDLQQHIGHLPTWEFIFSVLSFCLFILFMGFSRQEYCSGLPFPSPVDHILSDLSTFTCPSWVAPHGKVILKILQARLQQYVNQDFQMLKLDLEKAEEPQIKLPTSVRSSKKQKNSKKKSTSVSLTMLKP